jgi:hypothetical protein
VDSRLDECPVSVANRNPELVEILNQIFRAEQVPGALAALARSDPRMHESIGLVRMEREKAKAAFREAMDERR